MTLFNEQEKEYWKSLKVSPEDLEEIFQKDWMRRFKEILSSHETHLDIIASFLEVENLSLEDKDLLKKLLKTKKAIILYGLQKYITNKLFILKDFLEEIKDEYSFTNLNDILISIIELFNQSEEQIQNSNFYYLANKIPCLEKLQSEQITEEFLNEFENRISLVPFLKKKLDKRSSLSHKCQIGKNYFYFYERAKVNKVYEGYQKRISLLSKSNIILHFNSLKKTLRIITQDPRLEEVLSEFSERHAIQFQVVSPLEIEDNFGEKFEKIFTEEIEGFQIRKVNFNKLGNNTLCKATFEQSPNQQPLNITLNNLIEGNFIDPVNYRIFNSLRFSLNGFEFTIYVRKEEDFVTMELREELISETKRKEIFNFFKDNFSILLGADYYTNEITLEERKNILHGLLGKSTAKLTKKEEVVYREVRKHDIFVTQRSLIYKCSSNPAHTIPEGEENICPMCGNHLLVFSPREKIILDQNKLFLFLRKKMEEIYSKEAIIIKEISKDKNVIYVTNVSSNFIIYPYLYGSIKSKVKKLNEINVPIVQIVIDKKAPTYDYELSSRLFLYDFLYDDLRKIKKELEEVTIFKAEKKNIEDCKNSLEILEKISKGEEISNLIQDVEKGDAFEEICFPILKRIFVKILHWGRTRRFKDIPDGVFGIKMNSSKANAFSMLYDFKYSDNNYNIDKRQIREYIHKANQSKEIKKFSGELSSFIILSHNLTDTKFKNTAEKCQRLRKWKKGKCIKLDIKTLIYFYKKIEQLEKFDEYKKIALNLAFAKIIKNLKDRTIILTQQNIDQIMIEFDEIGEELDIGNLYKYLVKDEIF